MADALILADNVARNQFLASDLKTNVVVFEKIWRATWPLAVT